MTLDRRHFISQGLGGLGVFSLTPFLCRLPAQGGRHPPVEDDRILVILQLSGGNDGLSTVIPHGDDVYQKSRRRTLIPRKDVLAIDDHVGLHPNLGAMKTLYDAGHLAVVQGVGYPDPNRSHFESMDIWHAGNPRGRRMGTGWIGRLCDIAFAGTTDPNLVVHVGSRTPFALQSTAHPPVAFSTPQAYKWIGANEDVAALEASAPLCEHGEEMAPEAKASSSPHVGRDRALTLLRRTLHEAQASSQQVREATLRYRPRARYPQNQLAASLATTAALVTGGLSTRIFSVEQGGFDTHTNQRNRHDTLMRDLSNSLEAFLKDLAAHGSADRVVIMVFSEFGRRVQENGSAGTDHGVAGPVFLAGPSVRGGLHGRHPSLKDLIKGDLRHTTDFRSIYASLIRQWMGADPREVLGSGFDPLPLLPS
jgi:uncharacterized protein (DUF1501 family)